MATYHFDWLYENTNQFINSIINNKNFDIDKFDKWVWENNIKFKSDPNTYIKKIFQQEIDKGTFTPDPRKSINTNSVMIHLESRGIPRDPDVSLYLDILLNKLYQEYYLDIEEIRKLIDNALDWTLKQPVKSGKTLVSAIKRSQTIKNTKIDLKAVEIVFEKEKKEWKELLEQIPPIQDTADSEEEYIAFLEKAEGKN